MGTYSWTLQPKTWRHDWQCLCRYHSSFREDSLWKLQGKMRAAGHRHHQTLKGQDMCSWPGISPCTNVWRSLCMETPTQNTDNVCAVWEHLKRELQRELTAAVCRHNTVRLSDLEGIDVCAYGRNIYHHGRNTTTICCVRAPLCEPEICSHKQ